ncbi:D-alanyl-D-alanine carboxypeptidase/D-alanyl-D-alanine-endopeptidase [Methylophaga sp. OBS3]|uniref:D-alanyl-D-alanine carboxypeptidase/D-alanyl-D-alanine endopeptidase n=1 Tax=Methylophaga sp. OBS3 TaxID=2991934 RepID=UPI0022524685|nr:D-alanyl-D-alanine carboxypeptidase/D-alanyl-D-alanine-endopeptidase [Methylophaga sp. OBS3]MCX4188970.1 D-alanyl-D-alanine carboxypeptidase/D-alanyl-D-alanine-endopeptidase [Methylophaga sp. OBS3]
MQHYLILALLLLTSFTASANPTFQHPALAASPTPEGADVALYVIDSKTGKTVYAERADHFQQPASLQKLVTGLAAKLYLPKDFRFETTLETNKNDVIFRFSGDPRFTRTHLRTLIDRLKIHTSTITGNLYLNGSAFDDYERAIGVPWDIMGVCYSAPSSALSMNGNCVYGKLSATSEPPITAVKATASDLVSMDAGNMILMEGLNTDNIDCEPKLSANDNNEYTVGGCVGTHRLPVSFHLAVQNPTELMIKVLYEELKRAGITLNGAIIRNDLVKGEVIARHQSDPLPELVDEMVQKSDNLIADNLLKTMGRLYFKQPGSFENGAAAVKAILKEKANVNLADAVIVDGSGLSRNNRMTPKHLMQVVQYIFNHPEAGMVETLPVSGVSGTLRWRPSVVNAPLKGQIAAKTGSLYGVYNLAGRIKTSSGKSLLFVQIISNYHPSSKNRNVARKPIRVFERDFYEGLYNKH